MTDSRRGPAPPSPSGQGPHDSGARSNRANRRLAVILGGGVLAVALGGVAWAGLHGSSSPTVSGATTATGSATVIGPSVPTPTSTTAAVIGPVVGQPAPTTAPATTAPATTAPATTAPATTAPATTAPATTAPAKAATPVSGPATTPSTATPAAGPATAKPATTGPTIATPARVTPARVGAGHVATRSIRYRVVKGDTLWTLTARSLAATGRSSGPGNTATFLTRFYASNGTTVGSNPDLIVPGQVLTWPKGL